MLPSVSEFRYAQFCPIARACELLASRWTLLVVRDLFSGPQRFSDLLRSQPGISPSVLTERLAFLERHGIVSWRTLPPPAASTVYELTAAGRSLQPVLVELFRWGMRFMRDTQPGDHMEPRWVPIGLEAVARRGATPARSVELRVTGGPEPVVFRIVGGSEGTRVLREPGPADGVIETGPREMIALAAGLLPLAAAVTSGAARVEGDVSELGRLPELFELPTPN
jgi:DNA-binding HxlR family transcriptional regulator